MSIFDKAKDLAGDLKDKAGEIAEKGLEKVPDSVKGTAGDLYDKAGGIVEKGLEHVPDSVKGTAGDLKDKAVDLVDLAKDKLGMGSAGETVADAVEDAAGTVDSAGDTVAGATGEAAGSVVDGVGDVTTSPPSFVRIWSHCDQIRTRRVRGQVDLAAGRERRAGRDDLLAERHQGQAGQLERGDPERDADDRDAQQHAGHDVAEGQPQPAEQQPDDVAHAGQPPGLRSMRWTTTRPNGHRA